MRILRHLLSLLFLAAATSFCAPLLGQETTDFLNKALGLVHQAESSAVNPTANARKIDLLNQAITAARQAPNHRLQGHRVLAIQAIRDAIAEIQKGDPNQQAATDLETAERELGASISLAGGMPPPAGSMASPVPVPAAQTAKDYFRQGWAKMHQSNWNGAVADFDQAIILDPKYIEAYLERGSSKLMLKDRSGGMADYDQALQIDPKSIQAYLKRASANQMNDPKSAIADFDHVIALDPKNKEAYEGLATVNWMHQDNDETIAAYDKLIALNPKDWYAYGCRAMAKAAKGDADGAIADYGEDIQIEPTDFNAFHNRSQEKAKKGDLDGARADLTKAIDLGMHNAYVYRERADIEKKLDDLDGALADYDQVLALDAKNNDAFVNADEAYADRADIKLAKGDLSGAIADYNQAIVLKDKNTQQDYFCIWVSQQLQGKKADADAQLSAEMAKSLGFTWYWPADVAEYLLGQMSEPDFMNAAASPDTKKDGIQHAQALYYAGLKHLLVGDKTTAVEDFQKCLAANQKDESTTFLAQSELKAMGQSK